MLLPCLQIVGGRSERVGNYFKGKTQKYPDLLSQINNGDYLVFAEVLHKERYYTQDESKHAASMKKQKEYLDRTLKAK